MVYGEDEIFSEEDHADLIEQYGHGQCAVLAGVLARKLALPQVCFSHRGSPFHVAVELAAGEYFDAYGRVTAAQVAKAHGYAECRVFPHDGDCCDAMEWEFEDAWQACLPQLRREGLV